MENAMTLVIAIIVAFSAGFTLAACLAGYMMALMRVHLVEQTEGYGWVALRTVAPDRGSGRQGAGHA